MKSTRIPGRSSATRSASSGPPSFGITTSLSRRWIGPAWEAAVSMALSAAGAVDPTVVRVAGSFEIPVVARALAEGGCDCVVALGAVIKGETDHYEHVATQAIAGLRQVAVETGVPVGLGVLTTRRVEHARARSLPGPGNKGAEAALAAVRAANALRLLPRPSDG